MKLCIFTYPRSGSTSFAEAVYWHQIRAGTITRESVPFLDEPFGHHHHQILAEGPNGKLRHIQLPDHVRVQRSQNRRKRWALFTKHFADDYFIKMMARDLLIPRIGHVMPKLYPCYSIERRNVLSAFVSGLVAQHHNLWNLDKRHDKPVYERFVATPRNMRIIGTNYTWFYNRVGRGMQVRGRFFYEDVIEDPIPALKEMGMYHEGVDVSMRYQKLASFNEKLSLIINVGEVIDFYRKTIAPVAPHAEANSL